MIRIGIIGAGPHSSSSHGASWKLLAAEPDACVELVAVCDLDKAKADDYARKFGFAHAYDDIETMLGSEKLDGLQVITAVHRTESLVERVLKLGIPVLIEKPPGKDSEQTERFREIATKHGTPTMVSFNRRFSPAVCRAREWIQASSEERRPVTIIARMLRNMRHEPNFAFGTGIHAVDTVLSLGGTPETVSAWKNPSATPGCSFYSARVVFESGAQAMLVISPESGKSEETYEIHGQDCCVKIDISTCSVVVFRKKEKVLQWQCSSEEGNAVVRNGSLDEARAFLRGIESGAPFRPDLEESLLSMLVAEAIQAGMDTSVCPQVSKGTA